eukprot:TRINITY_DN537_c0_g1::TRINITY_DN537_c0_g1_i1::g.10409::m.10409 TRINITY_DN537_c0_g1::TRINITY_DN537_c0_g1_i1::g.10409  ORF type:complete len:392 (-),score=116.07,sp/Q5N7W3/RPN2_ORYSJ/32.45/3e-20,Ribophorin_II/PF05817.9/1.1e-43,DUF4131/PF13567.1/4.1,DUF4131/PF13567.1/1.3e+03,DUF4131/PF13567.1/9.3e+03 TRINITY_DN537_c0_g1_i1:387-1517(-)
MASMSRVSVWAIFVVLAFFLVGVFAAQADNEVEEPEPKFTVSPSQISLTRGDKAQFKFALIDASGKVQSSEIKLNKVSDSEGKKLDIGKSALKKQADGSYLLDLSSQELSEEFYTVEATVDGSKEETFFKVTAGVDISAKINGQTVQFPKTISKPLTLSPSDRVSFSIQVACSSTKEAISVHQAFARLSNDVDEFFVVGKHGDSSISFDFGLLDGLNGEYKLEVIVGDALIDNSATWSLGQVSVSGVTTEKTIRKSGFEATNGPLPLIEHQFRVPEKRAPSTISLAFTLASLAPLALLPILWGLSGANLKLFPTGAVSVPALIFHGAIAAIVVVYAGFFLFLNLFQTLALLVPVLAALLVFGPPVLRSVAAARKLD